jgi:hypothetical protein
MSNPTICAFKSFDRNTDYEVGCAADNVEKLIAMICSDGESPNDFLFFTVGKPLKLSLEDK